MAKKSKGISDEEFDKIAEAYLEEKFADKFGSGSKNNRDELMKKLKKIKMAVGGTTTKKMRGGGAVKMASKKKMRGGGMAKTAKKNMMRGDAVNKKMARGGVAAKKKMMRGGAVKKK